jgi:large subunit ribosomal protein L24
VESSWKDCSICIMKSKFTTSWISSVQPRKQRKYKYNAPLHVKHRFLNTNLSKELRKKYGKRSLPLRKGDEVLVMRGGFSKKKGKILEVNLKRLRVTVESLTRKKIDGTKVNVYLNPSNLQIQSLNLEDNKRLKKKIVEKGEKTKQENKPEDENVPEKK